MVCTGNRSSFIARIRAKPPKQTQEKTSKNAVRAAVKTKKAAEGNATKISVDGDMVIPPKARAGGVVLRGRVEGDQTSRPQRMEEDSAQAGIEGLDQARTRCSGAQFTAGINRAIGK